MSWRFCSDCTNKHEASSVLVLAEEAGIMEAEMREGAAADGIHECRTYSSMEGWNALIYMSTERPCVSWYILTKTRMFHARIVEEDAQIALENLKQGNDTAELFFGYFETYKHDSVAVEVDLGMLKGGLEIFGFRVVSAKANIHEVMQCQVEVTAQERQAVEVKRTDQETPVKIEDEKDVDEV
ncbi:hypothetical protein BDZ97DRAFT_1762567 [Flammula alnicola]|nr:hypothetical protein BDZ97DRAFT_1762567 [Flammula alnicola]